MNKQEIKAEIIRALNKHLDLDDYQVFVFGSRAIGSYQQWSDYDVGLLGSKPIGFHQLAQIKSDLDDSKLPVKVDIVDFNQVGDDFKRLALRHIESW